MRNGSSGVERVVVPFGCGSKLHHQRTAGLVFVYICQVSILGTYILEPQPFEGALGVIWEILGS